MVADIVGDHVLMYASDYPHGESAFPQSTNIVLGWNSMTGGTQAEAVLGQPGAVLRALRTVATHCHCERSEAISMHSELADTPVTPPR